ncbi:sensor histidine kinase [Myroides pelagicus]|uniref:sensor histidine kinase n=1 Tax=Myroides pelagicus TaxID=270914 RepID=UPI002DBBF1E3|nr:histidine kinase [Myroides pelagicus]
MSLYLDSKLNSKIPWTSKPLKRLIIQIIIQIIGVLTVIVILDTIILHIIDFNPPTKEELRGFYQWVIATILIVLMISSFSTGAFLLQNWKTTAIEAAEHKLKATEFELKATQQKQVAAEAELQALRLQLDTHFVFNNLSVLSELILEDQQLGYDYAENFTKVYRYLLVNSKKNLITVEEELKFLNSYLFLIKNRIGQGIVFEINIDKEKLSLKLPPLSLQLLIENALKHNRTLSDNPLKVKIYSTNQDELIVVNNLLPLIAKAQSASVGLNNITNRYALVSNKKPYIKKGKDTFTVKIPIIK